MACSDRIRRLQGRLPGIEEFSTMENARLPAYFLVFLSLSLFAAPLAAGVSRQWQTGQVTAAEISGHGSNSQTSSNSRSRSRSAFRTTRDIWWTYRIKSKGRIYSAVLRESPARSGLAVNSSIRFSAEKDRIYVVGSKGGRRTLRILSVRPAEAPGTGANPLPPTR